MLQQVLKDCVCQYVIAHVVQMIVNKEDFLIALALAFLCTCTPEGLFYCWWQSSIQEKTDMYVGMARTVFLHHI